jgi:hypothetical protein
MSVKLAGTLLALISGAAWAQVGGLMNAEVSGITSISDPAKAIHSVHEPWIAFSLPVLEGTRSPCCWKGKWNSSREVGCSLEGEHQSYGTRSDSPLTENVIAYVRINEGEVNSLRVMGEQCPMEADGAKVAWIGSVDTDAGLDWLESVARSGNNDTEGTALYALGLHRSIEASGRLYALAKEPGGDLAGEAIFWLGEARGTDGFEALKRLLTELPDGDSRREINFALTQNGTQPAIDLLSGISRTDRDPEQRGNALFWLAEEFPDAAEELLLGAIAREQDDEVLEQAVFAISQLPADASTRMLLKLARDDQQPREVRRQALFWLANSDDDKAVAALAELLTQ